MTTTALCLLMNKNEKRTVCFVEAHVSVGMKRKTPARTSEEAQVVGEWSHQAQEQEQEQEQEQAQEQEMGE